MKAMKMAGDAQEMHMRLCHKDRDLARLFQVLNFRALRALVNA